MEKIKYGYTGFDHSDGVDISDKRIKEAIDWVLAELKNGKVGDYCSSASGNNIVLGRKREDGVSVIVTNNYFEIKFPVL